MISLENGSLRCTLSAEAGGSVLGLWLAEEAVFAPLALSNEERLQPPTALPRAGSYPLVPYSNRIANAELHWQDQVYSLTRNFAPEPHSIHGVGWQRAWEILHCTGQSAALRTIHTPDARWPFAFEATQTFALTHDTLSMEMSVTNVGTLAAPYGLGWHPYFAKRPRARINFSAAGRWEMGVDNLPTHRAPSLGIDTDCAPLNVDHCFDGWSGELHLRDETLHTVVRSDLKFLVVYTRPDIDSVAVEPVSHVNNAFNMLDAQRYDEKTLGVRVLQSDETMRAWMSVQVNAVKE
jgi:aldose 1-epimerase